MNFWRRFISRRKTAITGVAREVDVREHAETNVIPSRDGAAVQPVTHHGKNSADLKSRNEHALALFKEHLGNQGIDPNAEFYLPEPCPAPPSRRSSITANTFAFRLIREVCAASAKKNVVVAPFGVEVALAVIAEGATGETKAEIQGALNLSNMQEIVAIASHYADRSQHKPDLGSGEPPELQLATSVWVDERAEVCPGFIDDARHFYAAEAFTADMGAPDTQSRLDNWANEKTHGLVPRVSGAVGSETVMALVNATYFRGFWATPFTKENTRRAEFHLNDGTVVMRQRMSRKLTCPYHDHNGLQAVRLRYLGERFSMCIYLPDDIESFVSRLTADAWASMRFTSLPGTVELPRTKLHCQHSDLVPGLSALGIKRLFTEAAELKDIAPMVFVNKVAQDARVEVDEEGTEAAAVTMLTLTISSAINKVEKSREFRFIVDRPYFSCDECLPCWP